MNRMNNSRKKSHGKSTHIPPTLLRLLFFVTGEHFKVDDGSPFQRGEHPIDELIERHLSGDSSLSVNPLSKSGETAWHVVKFSLADDIQHPFSKARTFVDELAAWNISAVIEVAEGGKGHYHVWIFHEAPIPAAPFSQALRGFGKEKTGIDLAVVPDDEFSDYFPLPLQGELSLMQRCVFVNTVGKMVKDQRGLLNAIVKTKREATDDFTAKFDDTHSENILPLTSDTVQPESEQIALEIVFQNDRVSEEQSHSFDGSPEKESLDDSSLQSIEIAPVWDDNLHSGVQEDQEPLDDVQKDILSLQTDDIPIQFDSDIPCRECIKFFVKENSFCIEKKYVESILSKNALFGIFNGKYKVAGIVDYEHKIIPVIGLSGMSGSETHDTKRNGKVLVISTGTAVYGLLIDRVGVVQNIPEELLQRSGSENESFPGLIAKVVIDEKQSLMCLDALSFIKAFPWMPKGDEQEEVSDFSESLLVLFGVNDTLFAVDGKMITEIVPGIKRGKCVGDVKKTASRITYNGNELPVLHLSSILGFVGAENDFSRMEGVGNSRILVITAGGISFGLEVDRIEGIRRKTIYKTSFPNILLSDVYCSSGLIRVQGEDGFRFLLDPQKLLSEMDFSMVTA